MCVCWSLKEVYKHTTIKYSSVSRKHEQLALKKLIVTYLFNNITGVLLLCTECFDRVEMSRALVATRKLATSSPQQTHDDVAEIISKSRHGDVVAILRTNKVTRKLFIVALRRMPLQRSDQFPSFSPSLHPTIIRSYPSIV